MDDTQGFQYLGHSNWTICSLLNWFCSKILPPFWSLFWGGQFLITPERGAGNEKRNSPKNWWLTEVTVLMAFKLDHLQPVELIMFQNFTILLIFILGRPIPYYPRERGWKFEKGFTQKWRTHRGFSTWGIQTGPFAACWTDFVPKFYHPFDLDTGEANSLLPQREAGNGKRDSPKNGWHPGVSVLGAFKLDHLQPVKLILLTHRGFQTLYGNRGWKLIILSLPGWL